MAVITTSYLYSTEEIDASLERAKALASAKMPEEIKEFIDDNLNELGQHPMNGKILVLPDVLVTKTSDQTKIARNARCWELIRDFGSDFVDGVYRFQLQQDGTLKIWNSSCWQKSVC